MPDELKCPDCGASLQPVRGTIADYWCPLCDETFDIEEVDNARLDRLEMVGG